MALFLLFNRQWGGLSTGYCNHNVRFIQNFALERLRGELHVFFNINIPAFCFAVGDVSEMDGHQVVLGFNYCSISSRDFFIGTSYTKQNCVVEW